MNNFINILKNTGKRSLGAIGASIAIGILLCSLWNLFDGVYENSEGEDLPIPIGVLAHEQSNFTAELKKYLSENLGMKLTESSDYDELSAALIDRKISGIIEIENNEVIVTFLDDYANSAFISMYLDTFISAYNKNPNAREIAIPVTVQSVTLKDTSATSKEMFYTIIGFYLNFALIGGVFTAFQLSSDRKNGVYRRQKASGIRTVPYVCGVCVISVLCSLLQAVIFTVYLGVMGVDYGVPVPTLLLLCMLFSLFCVGLSLLCALFFRSSMAIVAGIVGGGSMLSILGGAYFPLSMSPSIMQTLAQISPIYWFMKAVTSAQNGLPWTVGAVGILLFAALMYILSGVKFACEKG